MSNSVSRRSALGVVGGIGGAVAASLPLAELARASSFAQGERKAKLVVVGGHPDDPESGCGGTMARFADLGHEVVALYSDPRRSGHSPGKATRKPPQSARRSAWKPAKSSRPGLSSRDRSMAQARSTAPDTTRCASYSRKKTQTSS